MALRFGYSTGDATSISTRNEARGVDAALTYSREIRGHDFDIMPGFLESLLRLLAPAAVEKADFFQRLVGLRFRYTPQQVQFGTTYNGQERTTYQYQQIIRVDADSLVVPIESPRKSLDADATISFAPFNSLNANIALRTTRDLLPAHRASPRAAERSALQSARSDLIGVDLGWEASRSLTSAVNWTPPITSWLKPRLALNSRFSTDRNPSYIELSPPEAQAGACFVARILSDRNGAVDAHQAEALQIAQSKLIGKSRVDGLAIKLRPERGGHRQHDRLQRAYDP
jgi:hypothetical protein